MRIVALIFGVLGGLGALCLTIGVLAIGSARPVADSWGYFAVVVALVSLVGAGSTWTVPLFGSLLLMVSAAIIAAIGGFNMLSVGTLVLLVVGGGFSLGAYLTEHHQLARNGHSTLTSNAGADELLSAWGFVGIPLAWGVIQTVINAAKLFQ